MFLLADHLAIPTLALSKLQGQLSTFNYQCLTNESTKQFFAVTLSVGNRKYIVFNDHVAPTRQQSDMAHELSHAILGHPASELTNESGGRHYNKTLEAEAACLSGVLLVPRAAAIAIVASNKHPNVAANEFNISPRDDDHEIKSEWCKEDHWIQQGIKYLVILLPWPPGRCDLPAAMQPFVNDCSWPLCRAQHKGQLRLITNDSFMEDHLDLIGSY